MTMEGRFTTVLTSDGNKRSEQDKNIFFQFLTNSHKKEEIEGDEDQDFQKEISDAMDIAVPKYHNRSQFLSDKTSKEEGFLVPSEKPLIKHEPTPKFFIEEKADPIKTINSKNCKECLLMHKNKAFVLEHEKRGHKSTVSLKCPKCDFKSNFRPILETHQAKCHSSRNKNLDPVFQVVKKSSSSEVFPVVIPEASFKCKVCNKSFAQQITLRRHEGGHSIKELQFAKTVPESNTWLPQSIINGRVAEISVKDTLGQRRAIPRMILPKEDTPKVKADNTPEKSTSQMKLEPDNLNNESEVDAKVTAKPSAASDQINKKGKLVVPKMEACYMCSICGYKSDLKLRVRDHQHMTSCQKEAENRIIGIGCQPCSDGEKHIDCDFVRQEKEVNYGCSMCPFGTTRRASIKYHIIYQHKNMGANMMVRGSSTEPVKVVRHKCTKCDYTSSHRRFLNTHERLRHGISTVLEKDIIKCTFCDYETDSKRSNRNHNKEVHGKVKRGKSEIHPFIQCDKCDYKTKLAPYIKNHQLHVHGENADLSKVRRCTFCEFETGGKGGMIALKNHIAEQHSKEKNYACGECSFKSFGKKKMRLHVSRKHKNSDVKVEKLICPDCRSDKAHKECSSPTEESEAPKNWLQSYNRWPAHLSEFNCQFCPFSEKLTKKGVLRHMNAEHPQEKLFGCKSCPYKSNYSGNMNMHTNAKHSKKLFKCETCEWTTTWKGRFGEHMRFKHGVFKMNSKHKKDLELSESVCDLCGFSATSELSMRLHRKSQCDNKTDLRANRHELMLNSFPNYLLSKAKSMRNLRKRRKEVDGEKKKIVNEENSDKNVKYECTKCDYTSNQRRFLKSHERLHHGGPVRHKCSKCDYTANHMRFMKYHETLNHSSKAVSKDDILKCTLCDLETGTNEKMATHNREAHDKEKNYSCSLCSKKTFRRTPLVKHIGLKHPNTEATWLFIGSKHPWANRKIPKEYKDGRGRKSGTQPDIVLAANLDRDKECSEAHDKEKNYSCSLCSKQTFRRTPLVKHIRLKHPNTEATWLFIGSKPDTTEAAEVDSDKECSETDNKQC